jgi:hypothetical protein
MDDTELYADLNVDDPDQQEAKTLNLDDETTSYLDLKLEDEISVIDTGGGADVGNGKLTITQGGVTKGIFTANQKADVTIDVDAGGASEVTKAEFDAEVTRATNAETTNATAISTEETRAKAAEKTNADAITAETTRATAKETEIATSVTTEETRAKAAEQTNADAIAAEVTRAQAKEAEIEGKVDGFAPLASPAFTGTPTAPTATAGTSTTQIATCAFVADAINTAITEVENGTY